MIKSRVAFGSSLFISLFAVACGDDEGGSKGASCEEICERIEAPACENAAPDCIASCKEEKLNTPMDCESELAALSSCFAGATFTCDADEVPMANACKPQLDRWLECSDESDHSGDGDGDGDDSQSDDPKPGTDVPDNDDGDDGENICQASPDDDACDSCLKGSCCEETASCGPACQRIFDCMQECADDACIDACVDDNLDGAYQFSQLGTCMIQNCAGSCDLGE